MRPGTAFDIAQMHEKLKISTEGAAGLART
jgi:hypothetical protein